MFTSLMAWLYEKLAGPRKRWSDWFDCPGTHDESCGARTDYTDAVWMRGKPRCLECADKMRKAEQKANA